MLLVTDLLVACMYTCMPHDQAFSCRLQMEADHNNYWSPEARLQGCAGSLVADM